ncbi:MAG: flagellar protein FlbT [Desulfobacca sp.]|nr:flagellar protein FlbT [Desulfobacca sp.]
MALKITLKPHERMIIGGAVIANGGSRCDLIVENNVPILRQKDILSLKDADTPCRRIYFAIQLMYVDDIHIAEHHRIFWEMVKDVQTAAPSTGKLLNEICGHILQGEYYPALKLTRKLITYENEVIQHDRNANASL